LKDPSTALKTIEEPKPVAAELSAVLDAIGL
jgi:hypothetical protein